MLFILIPLLFFNGISCQTITYYSSLLEIGGITLDLVGDFGQQGAWFTFDLLVTSDSMLPVLKSLLKNGSVINANIQSIIIPENASVTIPNPAVIFLFENITL